VEHYMQGDNMLSPASGRISRAIAENNTARITNVCDS
jgi:hypothetical protein